MTCDHERHSDVVQFLLDHLPRPSHTVPVLVSTTRIAKEHVDVVHPCWEGCDVMGQIRNRVICVFGPVLSSNRYTCEAPVKWLTIPNVS